MEFGDFSFELRRSGDELHPSRHRCVDQALELISDVDSAKEVIGSLVGGIFNKFKPRTIPYLIISDVPMLKVPLVTVKSMNPEADSVVCAGQYLELLFQDEWILVKVESTMMSMIDGSGVLLGRRVSHR